MRSMKKLIFLISCIVSLISCDVEVEQNYGVASVVFPESRQDVITINGTILNDSLIKSIAVFRTGVTPTYQAIKVELSVDSDSLMNVINQADTASTPTTEQLWFKSVLELPASCYQLQKSLVIPKDERVAYLPITLIKSELDKLDKSKVWMIAFKIDSAQDIAINESNNIEFLKIIFASN